MISIFTHIKKILTPVTLLITLIVLSAIVLEPCKGSSDRASSIPSDADYNKKTNVYKKITNGVMREWYENGNLVSISEVNEYGILNGRTDRFDYLTGVLYSYGNFQMGERAGKWIWGYSDGRNYMEINFVPGNRKRQLWIPVVDIGNETGQYVRYFRNGRINEKGFYDGGNKEGDWVKYYPDTKIESKGSFLKDKKTGEWFYYYPTGAKEAMELYSNEGILLKRITFYPNGKIWCETIGNQTPVCKS